jgi:branched-chain amino acid transport system ATP-binding protein
MLEIRDLQVSYGNIQVLHEVSLSVGQGEIVTLIGSNGAGKTTILMTICGIVAPTAGRIFFGSKAIQAMQPDKVVSLGISQVPEGRRVFPQLTVLENLELGAFLRKDKKAIKDDMEYIFELFPILAARKKQPGGTLSGGEQQMLAISRAMMARPRLLLLDEPSLGLAPLMIQQIFAIISKINRQQKTTVLLVEQNANLALQIANRGYVLENGRVVMSDSAENLQQNEQVRQAYLGL